MTPQPDVLAVELKGGVPGDALPLQIKVDVTGQADPAVQPRYAEPGPATPGSTVTPTAPATPGAPTGTPTAPPTGGSGGVPGWVVGALTGAGGLALLGAIAVLWRSRRRG